MKRQRGTTRQHIVTVNVEDYFQVGAFKNLIPYDHWHRFDTRIQRNIEATLELLSDTGNTATFFVSGWIAENHPDILRLIVDAGHEIGCSGYYQQSIRDIPPPAFKQDLQRSRAATEDVVGHAVHGFRIGRGRVDTEDLWLLDVLAEQGFLYDSSVIPIGRQLNQSKELLRVNQVETATGGIWEVPPSSWQIFGWSIPFSGGNYIRQLPNFLTREAVARWVERRDAPLVMYFHIWELDTDQPNISAANWLQNIRHYRNLENMADRVRYFLDKYPFTSIGNYLELSYAPAHHHPRFEFEVNESQTAEDVKPIRNDLTIVIPCYNEEASLEYLGRTLENFAQDTKSTLNLRFVMVDDGSTDGTWNKLVEIFDRQATCELIQHERNQGIASAILTGAKSASTDLIAVIDADCTFDPTQISEMMKLMDPTTAAVCASPFHPHGSIANVPAWRLALSRGAAFLYRCVLNHQFSSYTSCFRIYRRQHLDDMQVHYRGFCGVAEILARLDQQGLELRECPAELQIRVLGQSKINLAATIVDHLKLIARIAGARWFRIPLPRSSSA